jgi:DNA-directed RNA polymerase sigma subunit (sigma70/sigma32)
MLDRINIWLGAIYREETRISDLLLRSGIPEHDIERVKEHHVSDFVAALLAYIQSCTDGFDAKRRNLIMLRYFGLLDGRTETLQSIADDFALSRERIRQLRDKRLMFFRRKKRRTALEAELCAIAKKLLNE